MRQSAVKGVFDSYIRNNRILLIICTACMILGICAGSVYCASLSGNGTLRDSIGDFGLLTQPCDGKTVFLSSLVNSMQLAFFIWLCGCTKLGVPAAPLLLALKGFVCGFCIASLVSLYGGIGLAAASVGILPQMIVMFALMEVFCVAAINQALYAPKSADKSEKRRRFVSYCIFCSLLFAGFALCSLFESYVAPYLLIWTLGL